MLSILNWIYSMYERSFSVNILNYKFGGTIHTYVCIYIVIVIYIYILMFLCMCVHIYIY